MSFRSGVILQLGTATAIVSMDSAVEKEKATSLKTVCLGMGDVPHPPTAIQQQYRCPECFNTDRGSFKKASIEGGAFTVVETQEVADAKATTVGTSKAVINLSVHRKEEVALATIQNGESVYYLTPSKPAYAGFYDVIRYALEHFPEYTVLGEWTPTSKAQLFEFKMFGSTIVMEGRARPEDLKVAEVPRREVSAEIAAMLDQFVPAVVKDFDPATYADTYRTELAELLATKETVEGQVIESATVTTKVAPVGTLDITAMLAGALAAVQPPEAKKPATRKPRAKKAVA
jgi:non-homologous end joining protein Ku